jgi:hypothetical protein
MRPATTTDPEHEEAMAQPLKFSFTPAGMTGFRDTKPNLENEEPIEVKENLNLNNKPKKTAI